MSNSIPFQLENSTVKLANSKESFAELACGCIRNADSFYEIANLALSSNNVNTMFGVATRSCIAFACELYLKSLSYISETGTIRKHDLDQLYEALDDEIKDKVYYLHPKGNCPEDDQQYFFLQIKELRKAFEVFRYDHERGSYAYNLQFLLELADTLRIIAVSKCDENAQNNGLNQADLHREFRTFMLSRSFAKYGFYCCKVESRAYRIMYCDEDV